MTNFGNPLAWAGAISILVLSLGLARTLFRTPGRLTNLEVGFKGIHAQLNGYPSAEQETLGQMVYDVRRIVDRQARTLDAHLDAHRRCNDCPVEAVP